MVDTIFRGILAECGLLCVATCENSFTNSKRSFFCFTSNNPYCKDSPNINAPTIGSPTDYAKLKLVATKHLLFEFHDCLDNNFLSIFFDDKDKRDLRVAEVKRLWGELPENEIRRLIGEEADE